MDTGQGSGTGPAPGPGPFSAGRGFALRQPAYDALALRLPAVPPQRIGGHTMGTYWSLHFADAAGDAGLAPRLRRAVEAVFDTVIVQMSHWEPDSLISRFNRADAGSRHVLPEAFATVLACALHWARASAGAFDPTVAPLVEAWGFGPCEGERDYRGARPPGDDRRARARQRVGWQGLQFETGSGMLVQPGGLCLDLSGIAKGFAVDRAAEAVRGAGVADFLLEIGGELRAAGRHPGGRAWTVGIEQPGDLPALPLALHDCAIATSGDRWHAWQHEGRRYAHTLDPRTGEPVAHDLASVSVVHPECMQADALATVLLVLGPQHAPAFAERHGVAACWTRRSAAGGHVSTAFGRLP